MLSHCRKYHRLYLSMLFMVSLIPLTGCNMAWADEASSIIKLLIPAIQAALAILSGLGAMATDVDRWGVKATNDLSTVEKLIELFKTAAEDAKAGILSEIQQVLLNIATDLNSLMPRINSVSADVQKIFQSILIELQALVGAVPVLSGVVTNPDEAKRLLNRVQSAQEFKKSFNKATAKFGAQYKL